MMHSPFPGMDPYLERPSGWAAVHSRLINSISDDLVDRVAPGFLVTIEERVYITDPEDPERRPLVPDVMLVRRGVPQQTVPGAITIPTLIEPLIEPEVRDQYLEIRDAQSREVVTTVEVLSPYNKAAGTPGREAFLRKRAAVMASRAHWIEIDLLRAGERPPEVRRYSDYYALLKRGGAAGPFEVWFVDLRDSLPTIAVPLREPLEDVALDLQAVVATVFRRGRYAEALAYDEPAPPPPLPPADARWAAERLAAWRAGGGSEASSPDG